MNELLVISQHSPFSESGLKDALDMALIFAAVDGDVAWLFTGSSVHALKKNQNPHHIKLKDVFKALKTLEIYDVEQIYISEPCLIQAQLSREDLAIEATLLQRSEMQELIAKFSKVVTL